ncbi:MAG: hypothetical protein JW789_03585 [Candidatus Aenigmarchaeota archaeon]|nr:hypothetical protein [Candidatus Aenigmarchaeota archaeon]
MAGRYPSTSFGTHTQTELCNNYFDVMENGSDWRDVETAYRNFMNNNHAERGVGILTNSHMVSDVEKSHMIYKAETLNKFQSAHGVSTVLYDNWETEEHAYKELMDFLKFNSTEFEINLAEKIHRRYERNRKWHLVKKGLSLIGHGF